MNIRDNEDDHFYDTLTQRILDSMTIEDMLDIFEITEQQLVEFLLRNDKLDRNILLDMNLVPRKD
jgi:hypothetical protein